MPADEPVALRRRRINDMELGEGTTTHAEETKIETERKHWSGEVDRLNAEIRYQKKVIDAGGARVEELENLLQNQGM